VKITLTGKGQLTKIAIEKSLMNSEESDMVEDLIVAAHRDAKDKADAAMADAMGALTGGMNLPAGMKLPF
jgi:DNA-binding protein YbaB